MFGLRGLHPDLEIGGFDTAFATIAPALAERGHEVTIYCRASAHSPSNRAARDAGVALVHVPSPGGKNFAAVTSTLCAVLHAFVARRYDVWFFVNVGMGHHAALARLSGRPVVMNVDGLDWTRAKWGPMARLYYRSAARAAVRFCTALVTDARAMQEFYRARFGRESEMIAYGAEVEESVAPEKLERFGVRPREYYLIVSRLIPENSLVAMLEGFRRSRTERKLVVVGGATYEDAFQAELRALAAADPRVVMAGQVADQDALRELWCNCHAYLHGHSVGGTNPALLRAMGDGSCVLALDTPFNREVLGETGLFFGPEPEGIAALVDWSDAAGARVEKLRTAARDRVRALYSWGAVVDQYEALFRSVVRGD